MPAYSNWLKMRVDLLEDLRVLRVASLIGERKHTALGLLYDLWRWADFNSEDGTLPGVDAAMVDAQVGQEGFAAALVAVGWLVLDGAGATIPRFDTHNGESARRRAKHAERTAARRAERSESTPDSPRAHKTRTGRAHGEHPEEEQEREEEQESWQGARRPPGRGVTRPEVDEAMARRIVSAYPRRGGKVSDLEEIHMAAVRIRADPEHPGHGDPYAYLEQQTKAYAASKHAEAPPRGTKDWRRKAANWFKDDLFDADDAEWAVPSGDQPRNAAKPTGEQLAEEAMRKDREQRAARREQETQRAGAA